MFFARPSQVGFHLLQIVMGKDTENCTARAGSVDEAGVGQLVHDDDIFLAGECENGSGGCSHACREDQGGLRALRRRQFLF